MKKKYLLLIFSSIFLVSSLTLFFFVDGIKPHQDIDSQAYIERGLKFATTNSILENERVHPPYFVVGYPFFLGLIYKIFGFNDFFIIWFQVFLSLLSGFLIFVLCEKIFNQYVGLISFAIFSLNFGYIVFAQFILTEILLSFFLLLFLFLFLMFFKHSRIHYLILSSLFLGISILIKPAAIYFVFFIIPLIIFFKKGNLFQRSKYIIVILFFFYLPVVSYMTFNKYFYNQFKISALGDVNLYIWYYPNVLSYRNNTDAASERAQLDSSLSCNRYDERCWNNIRKKFFKEFISDPFPFIFVWLKNVAKTFFGLYLTNMKVLVSGVKGGEISYFKVDGSFLTKFYKYIYARTESKNMIFLGFFELFFSILKYLFVLAGFISLLIKKRYDLFFIFGSFIFYFSFITGHDGCARFRMMFEFVLIILSSLGIYVLFLGKREL